MLASMKVYKAECNPVQLRTFNSQMKHDLAYGVYQRTPHWKEHMKPDFIKSLIAGIQPPPIVTNRRTDEPSKEYIIDGGHRTRSIMEFMNGDFGIEIDGDVYYYKKPTKIPNGQYKEFDLVDVNVFNRIAIPVQTYNGLDSDGEHDIFCQLNKQVPLTKGQQINAMNNGAVRLLRELCNDTGDWARTVLDKRSSKEDGYMYLETLTPIFTCAIMQTGGYEISYDTSKYISHANEEHTNVFPEFREAVCDSLRICEMLISEGFRFGKLSSISLIRKCYFLSIVKAKLYCATNDGIMAKFSEIEKCDDHEWYDNISNTNLNTKKLVNRRAAMLC